MITQLTWKIIYISGNLHPIQLVPVYAIMLLVDFNRQRERLLALTTENILKMLTSGTCSPIL